MNGENSKILADCKDELISIQQWIQEGRNKFDPKSQYLIAYCIIKACGTIERIYKNIVFEALNKGVTTETSTYLTVLILESSSNPSSNNICQLLKKISKKWNDDFKKSCIEVDKSNLDSLVKLRNSFSHGNKFSTSIESVIEYYDSSTNIISTLDNILG